MKNYSDENFIMLPVPACMFGAVCALLGGASAIAITSGGPTPSTTEPRQGPKLETAGEKPAADAKPEAAPAAEAVDEPAHDPNDIDAGGHPWSADLHASTRTKTKDGYWRLKVGAARPDPLPGFPKGEAAASNGATGTASNGTGSAPGASASAPAAGPATAEDDEFAAFRAAAAKSEATDTAAAATVPARKWTDGDLGALCNQAAVKLGDPTPIKEIIAQFVPAGQVAHSRMIPDEKREEFAKAVEAKAGITFAG